MLSNTYMCELIYAYDTKLLDLTDFYLFSPLLHIVNYYYMMGIIIQLLQRPVCVVYGYLIKLLFEFINESIYDLEL